MCLATEFLERTILELGYRDMCRVADCQEREGIEGGYRNITIPEQTPILIGPWPIQNRWVSS